MAMLRRHGLITEWYDHDIEVGSEWREEIERELEAADLIVLLVSADFLASDFAYEKEMLHAVNRANRGQATVIPVMLRPVDGWEASPFAKFQVLPRNARPITRWSNADEAYTNVVAGIRSVLEDRVRSGSAERALYGSEVPHVAELAPNPEAAAQAAKIVLAINDLVRQANVADYIIVIGDEGPNYFTQCFTEETSFWCEAVSNQFLHGIHELKSDQTSLLAAFGWNPPGADLPNWWCVKDDVEDVAALMVRTLNEVYGVDFNVPFQIARSWDR